MNGTDLKIEFLFILTIIAVPIYKMDNLETETPTPENLLTPKQFRHRRVTALKDAGGKTPLLKIPASPLLQMLGYGSG